MNIAAERGATRLTAGPDDGSPIWLDADRVVFLRPEKGLPYGRAYVVSPRQAASHANFLSCQASPSAPCRRAAFC